MYKKIGFKQEGILREFLFREGAWHDLIQMGILKHEYNGKKLK
ncbi:GNAT family N-acetyltransferase [Paenibacillus sp. FSL M7-1455]